MATREKILSRRKEKRERRMGRASPSDMLFDTLAGSMPKPRPSGPFHPRTDAQEDYYQAISSSVYTFGVGPAGTGKTYVAAISACEHLLSGEKTRVVLTRPAVEAAGERLGFLPGRLEDKFGPYMKPLMNILIERLGRHYVEGLIKRGRIESLPMAFMRGETFKDTLVIADEMQNATREQMKMLLTRLGEGSRMVVDGDPAQSDVDDSGLEDAVYRMDGIEGVSIVRFTRSDIVRHSIIQEVVEAYENG